MTTEYAELLARAQALLEHLAYQRRPCRLCGVMVYWIEARDGSRYALDADLQRHRATCTRPPPEPVKRTRQDALFPRDQRAQAFDPK